MIKKLKCLFKKYLNDRYKSEFKEVNSKNISYEDYKYLLNRTNIRRNF